MSFSVIIAGDFCPIGDDLELLGRTAPQILFPGLYERIAASDFAIVNLECPLVDDDHPIPKCGPVLRAPSSSAVYLRNIGFHAVGLANNHIRDHGNQGVHSTLHACSSAGLECVGAGRTPEDAGKPLIIHRKGKRLGVVAFADPEFSIVDDERYGAAPIDVPSNSIAIQELREKVDFVLVLLHAGNEGYALPSPELQELCRFYARQGAAAVVCQHSHCVGAWENYCGASIVYGQGNFFFGLQGMPSIWNIGVLVEIVLDDGTGPKLRLLPFKRNPFGGLSFLAGLERDAMDAELAERSALLLDRKLLERSWEEFCLSERSFYLNCLEPESLFQKMLRKLIGRRRPYDSKRLRVLGHLMRCDAHRQAVQRILQLGRLN